jgi:hypothetical protein
MSELKSLESKVFKETISSDAYSGSEGTVAKQRDRQFFFSRSALLYFILSLLSL